MALRSSYYGLKKKLLEKVKALPAIKSIGAGLSLNASTGELTATGGGGGTNVVANPEGEATAALEKLKVGEGIYSVALNTYATTDETEAGIVDSDYIPFLDSSAASGAGAPKKSTWSNIKSKLKSYFDSIYGVYLTTTSKTTSGGVDTFTLSNASITSDTIVLSVLCDKPMKDYIGITISSGQITVDYNSSDLITSVGLMIL